MQNAFYEYIMTELVVLLFPTRLKTHVAWLHRSNPIYNGDPTTGSVLNGIVCTTVFTSEVEHANDLNAKESIQVDME